MAEAIDGDTSKIIPEPDLRAVDKILIWVDCWRWYFFSGLAVLNIAGFNGQWRIEPDGALYLSLARNIAEGHGYTYHGQPHHLAYPGLPYLIAGLFKLFGAGNLWPIHVLMVGLAFAALALTFRLIRLHHDRANASVVTLILGLTFLFFSFGFQLRNDMPFLVGVMAFLAGYEAITGERIRDRRIACWFDWALMIVGLGLCVVMRPAMWALVMALVLSLLGTLLIRRSRQVFIVLAVVVVGLVIFLLLDPRRSGGARVLGDYEDRTVFKVAREPGTVMHDIVFISIPQMLEPIVAETMLGIEMGPGVNTVVSLTVLAIGFALLRRRALWGWWVIATVAMMLIVLRKEEILPRYLLAVFPLLVYAAWRGMVWLNHALPRPWDWAAVVLLVMWLTPNCVKIGGFLIEQHQHPFLAHYKQGRYPPLLEMAKAIHEKVESNALILAEAKAGRVLSYYSERRAVDTWEVPAFDPAAQPVYVLRPMDENVRARLESLLLYPGEPIVSISQPGADAPPLTLHRVTPVKPPSSTQPEILGEAGR